MPWRNYASEQRDGALRISCTHLDAAVMADCNDVQGYLYLANQDRSAWTWELDRKFFRISLDETNDAHTSCSAPCPREVVNDCCVLTLTLYSIHMTSSGCTTRSHGQADHLNILRLMLLSGSVQCGSV